MSKTVIILGRGHSGSRTITQFFMDNGFFMGKEFNGIHLDKEPCHYLWDISKTIMEKLYYLVDNELRIKPNRPKIKFHFKKHIDHFLDDILNSDEPLKGSKNAVLTFLYEWLVAYYPDFYYLFWTRSISQKNEHNRGNLADKKLKEWGYPVEGPDLSWKIHYDIIKITPQPKNFLHMRFEDFVLNHDESVNQLEKWLDIKLPNRKKTISLAEARTLPEPLRKYLISDYTIFPDDHNNLNYKWLEEPMRDLGYIK